MARIPQVNRLMALAEAQRIGLRPHAYKPGLWERALSILKRWASEPCLQREYDKRIAMCRRVYIIYTETLARIERKEEWQRQYLMSYKPKRKRIEVIVKAGKPARSKKATRKATAMMLSSKTAQTRRPTT